MNFRDWIPTGRQALTGGEVAIAILAAGFLGLYFMRRPIVRARLMIAWIVAVSAATIYFSSSAAKPTLVAQHGFWLRCLFWAAILFSIFRALDRLLVLPILTRGGKAPVSKFVHQVILIVIGLFFILGFGSKAFDWDIDRFLEGSAVVSIVLGLALQETLGNFFSGLVMQASSPFSIGDWITCAGVEGRVVEMTWRAVTIHTVDDNHVLIPNGTIAKEQIVNFHSPTMATARSVSVGLEYELPPGLAMSVLAEAAGETPGVQAHPAPFVYLDDFADSAVAYRVKFWISEPSQHRKIETSVRKNIWYRLKQKGYNIPFPIRTVEHTSLRHKTRYQSSFATEQRLGAIENQWLFQTLPDAAKRALAEGARDLFLSAGQVLFRQGDAGQTCYIIRQGEVDVLARSEGGIEAKVATLKTGDFFGEMSALTGQPRTATIRAVNELAAVEISKEALAKVFAADPSLMEQMSQVIAQRNVGRLGATQQADANRQPEEQIAEQQRSLFSKMIHFFKYRPNYT